MSKENKKALWTSTKEIESDKKPILNIWSNNRNQQVSLKLNKSSL